MTRYLYQYRQTPQIVYCVRREAWRGRGAHGTGGEGERRMNGNEGRNIPSKALVDVPNGNVTGEGV